MELEISKCKNTSRGNGDSFPPVPNHFSKFAKHNIDLITYRTVNDPGAAGVRPYLNKIKKKPLELEISF